MYMIENKLKFFFPILIYHSIQYFTPSHQNVEGVGFPDTPSVLAYFVLAITKYVRLGAKYRKEI